jgi:dolichol-phosphate mannosyltransferase
MSKLTNAEPAASVSNAVAQGGSVPKTSNGTIARKDVSLGIVCPMANERTCAARFVEEVLAETEGFSDVKLYVILDRVSKDGTRDILDDLAQREPRLRVVWAPENRCVVDAYVRGYKEALAANHDYILEMDAGFSHQPKDMQRFFEAMEKGYDCVFGSRFMPGGQISETPWTRRYLSRGGTVLANLLLGTRLRDMTSGFELFSQPALRYILGRGINSRAHFFQTEIKFHAKPLRIIEVPIEYAAASPSVSSSSIKDAFKNLFRLVSLNWKKG